MPEKRQQGQATIEATLLAGLLLLLFTVPVTSNGMRLIAFLSELLLLWERFQSAVWDSLLLLPMVLK